MLNFPECDWKILRELKPVLLDRLCGKILRDAANVATEPGITNHQRYLKLWEMIQDQNDEVARAFDDHRRSTAFIKMLQIRRLGLFTEEEFARFSEAIRKQLLDLEPI